MNPEIDETEFHVNTVKQVFQTRNALTVRLFKQHFQPAIAPKELETIIYLALYSLSETDPESFTWALHHYDRNLHMRLRANITAYAIHQLITFGFILGSDFSSLPGGNIILRTHAYHFLIQDSLATSGFIYLLLKEILQIAISPTSQRLNPLTNNLTIRAYPPQF